MLKPSHSKKFKKDLKKYEHEQKTMLELKKVITHLLEQTPLDEKYCDHPLSGNWKGHRECHVKPDALLIYKVGVDTLHLERFGSHSDLLS